MITASAFGFANKTFKNIAIIRGVSTPLELAGIRIPRRKASFQPYILLLLHLTMATLNLYGPGKALSQRPVLFMLIHGFGIAKASCRLVIHSMTREAMPAWDTSLLAPFLSLSTSYLLSRPAHSILWPQIALALVAILDHASYCTVAIRDICEARDIYTFQLKHGTPRVIDEGFYIAGTSPTGVPDAARRWRAWRNDPKNEEAFLALYGVE